MKEELSHFCIHVKDMDKAVAFYRDKLGFEVQHQTDDWSELELNNKINLALHRTKDPGSGIGFYTNDCEKATSKLEEKGVEISMRCQERSDSILTQILDPDGNILWIAQKK